jgi:hypothetical protein
MSTSSNPQVGLEKHFSSSILLWMRTDQARQNGMDHWKGPHSGIIAASPGLEEYRQLHLAEASPGLWPTTLGVETRIPADRKVDGVAEVTFQSALSPLKGRAQTKLAFQDEINVFRRTLLYAGLPGTSRWYDVAGPADQRFHASLVLGFADPAARTAFFEGTDVKQLSQTLAPVAAAIHAYDVSAALTYVRDGKILPHYQE